MLLLLLVGVRKLVEEVKQGILQRILGNPNAMGALAMGFNNMRLKPDPTLNQVIAQRQDNAAKLRASEGVRNRTVETLTKMGYPDLAEAVSNQSMDPGQAVSQAFAHKNRPKPVGRAVHDTKLMTLGDAVVKGHIGKEAVSGLTKTQLEMPMQVKFTDGNMTGMQPLNLGSTAAPKDNFSQMSGEQLNAIAKEQGVVTNYAPTAMYNVNNRTGSPTIIGGTTPLAPTTEQSNFTFSLKSPAFAKYLQEKAAAGVTPPETQDAIYLKEDAKRLAIENQKTLAQSGIAASNVPILKSLRELYAVAPNGALSGRLAEMFPELNDASAVIESLRAQLAPQLRVEGSGSTSDIEYAGMLKALGSMRNSPEANSALIDLMLVKSELITKKAAIVRKIGPGGLSVAEAKVQTQALEDSMWLRNTKVASIKSVINQSGGGSSNAETGVTSGGISWSFN